LGLPRVEKVLALRGGLLKGKTIGIDSTTLEANAAMKSIVRRDTQESYTEYLQRLAQAEGVEVEDPAGGKAHGPQAGQEDVE
jgi:transposase